MKKRSPVFPDGLVIALIVLTASMMLTACSSPVVKATEPATVQPSATATMTPTPEPTLTPTPVVFEGRLFFDMNGSGLRDEASFQYEADRLSDERQPLQADLLAALTAYLAEHPELQDGDLVTLEEPGLSGYTVCAKSNCVTTDAKGKFQLVQADAGSRINITIKDPNAGTPALEMRYTNKWKGEVTVPEYTREVDAATMGQLSALPDCGTDAGAMVCKQDTETLLVREQHLNDTLLFKITDGATIQPNSPNELGLLQGFLTLPYFSSNNEEFSLANYVDLDTRTSFGRTFSGIINIDWDAFGETPLALSDQHFGLDIFCPIGTPITSPESGNAYVYISGNGSLGIGIDHNHASLESSMGHFSLQLIEDTTVYRNQILGLCGSTGTNGGSHLHWHIVDLSHKITPPAVKDQFGDLLTTGEKRIVEYTGKTYSPGQTVIINDPISLWNIYNYPSLP